MHLMLQQYLDTGNLDEYAWITTRDYNEKGKGVMFISLDTYTQTYFTVEALNADLEEAKEEEDAEGVEQLQDILQKIEALDWTNNVLIMTCEKQKVTYFPVLKNNDTHYPSKTTHRGGS